MRTLDLPDALRAYGVEPVLVAGWETRGNDYPARPRGGLRHWTAGSPAGRTPSLGIVTSGRSDLPGPLCAVLQSREAPGTRDKAYVVSSGKANHAGAGDWRGLNSNYHLMGLEIEWAGPTESFPLARVDVSERIMAAFLDVCHSDDNSLVAEHHEYALPAGRKIDTNLSGDTLRQHVAILRSHLPTPTPLPKDDDDMIQIVNLTDPKAAPGTVRAGTHTYAVSGVTGRHMERAADIDELIKRFGAVDERPKGTTSSLMFNLIGGPLAQP